MNKYINLCLTVFLFNVYAFAQTECNVSIAQQLRVAKMIFTEATTVGIIWNNPKISEKKFLNEVQRGASAVNLKAFVAYVNSKKDISENFNLFVNDKRVDFLLVFGDGDIFNDTVSMNYLIKNATLKKIALISPSKIWVDNGGFLTITRDDSGTKLFINSNTVKVLKINIPTALTTNVFNIGS